MSAWTQLTEPGPALLVLVLAVTTLVSGAPLDDSESSSEIEYYPVADATGCYYNFEHYDEGDRIITNEPCLNCTCHNRMLMCYLRVCPFTKAIGQDCKVEKKPDQCCPVITCPEVPVHLLPHTSPTPSTAVGHLNEYGCSIDNLFYSDGAKVPSNPNNPCEVCYCIRNKTACIIQECTLTGNVVQGCSPVYVDGVCCPVRYDCDHPELETTPRPLLTTTTTTLPPTSAPTDCIYQNEVYADGALMKKDVPCEQCYCMKGDIVCAVQECGPTPLDKVNCTALPAKEGQCCPDTYECENISEEDLTTLTYYEAPTTQPTIISSSETATTEVEKSITTIQEEEQPSVDTESLVTESITEGIEDSGTPQPVTESATTETFTSRITQAVDTITSRVTDIVEAIATTVSGSEQKTTEQPEVERQPTEPVQPTVTEKTETTDQQTATESEVEEGTKPELVVTESTSQGPQTPESEEPKVIATEKTETVTEGEEITTDAFEIPVHDDHEEEQPHEEENEVIEGSGKPIEEQPITPVTPTFESEDKHSRPIDQSGIEEQPTTQQIEGGLITTNEPQEEVTEEGSGAPVEETSPTTAEPQPTIQTEVEVATDHGELPTIPGENIQTESVTPQVVTDKVTTEETTESVGERQGTTQEAVAIDAEAQETIQPLVPERSTEQTETESSVKPEVEIIVNEVEPPHPDITTQPEEEFTEEIRTEEPRERITTTESSISETVKPEDKVTAALPSVQPSQATTELGEEEKVTYATEEPVVETTQNGTTIPEEHKPISDIEENKPVTTTEKEELEFITEISTKETERPESMDHISETASPTSSEPETEVKVTEKPIHKEIAQKGIDSTETEPTDVTLPGTDQSQLYTKAPELDGSTNVPASPEVHEICGDKDCKSSQDENEIPTEIEESCTKEGCRPQEQMPSSELTTETTVPVDCNSDHGCVQAPDQEDSKVPGGLTPEKCSNETGCTPDLSEKEKSSVGKEGEVPVTDKIPQEYSPICNNESGCVPQESDKQTPEVTSISPEQCNDENDCKTIQPSVSSDSNKLPEVTGATTDETVIEGTTEQPEEESSEKQPASKTEQPDLEGSGEEPAGFSEHPITSEEDETTLPELAPTTKPEEQTEQTIDIEKETTEPSIVEVQPEKITEGKIVEVETTTQLDSEKESEITSALPGITPLHDVTLSEGAGSTETPKSETVFPEEPELAVSPIEPERTEVPETISTSSTETQRGNVPAFTELPGEATNTEEPRSPDIILQTTVAPQQIITESIIRETTQQIDTKETPGEAYGDETTSYVQRITPETTYAPEVVTSEETTTDSNNIPQGTERPTQETGQEQEPGEAITQETGQEQESGEEITQVVPILNLEGSITTEGGTKPEVITQIPEVVSTESNAVSVDSDATESIISVTETQRPEVTEILESTPASGINVDMQTTVLSQESQGTELPGVGVTEDMKNPEKVSEILPTTEQPGSQSTQVPDNESEAPQESTPGETSEIAESTEQIPSERIPTEVSQTPVETEVSVSATEPEIEVTSESAEEHGIPGEGSCLVDGQTYKNNSYVPPINQCQTSCKCLSSILQCKSIPCTPPPSNLQCTPIFHSPDACCPTYSCSVPGTVTSMESDSHVVETTTVSQGEDGQVTVGTQVIPSEGVVPSEAVTDEDSSPTTVHSETITEGPKVNVPTQSISESETEQSNTEPSDLSGIGETTEPSGSQVTTQKEGLAEEITVVPVTETESQTPESKTVIPDRQATISREGSTTTPSVKPTEESVPNQDDIENEIPVEPIYPEHCGTDGCAPAGPTELPQEENITSLPGVSQPTEQKTQKQPEVEVTDQTVTETEEKLSETTITSVTEPSHEISEQTEGLKIDTEEATPGTTESPASGKPIEEETKDSMTEKPHEEINTEQITDDRTATESFDIVTSETVTEINEESSQTPEEIAAAPEMEEAVTTPSVLTMTEAILSEVSPKVSEQTTARVEDESKITTEVKPEILGTTQPTTAPEAELTIRPQPEETSTAAEGESTEELETSYQPTVPTLVPVDNIQTTQGAESATDLEHITESNVSATPSPLETEAHVTEIIDKESERPIVPITEIVPESTSKQTVEITSVASTKDTGSSQRTEDRTESLTEEAITQNVPVAEQQPSKQDSEQESVSTEPTTPASYITETSTDKSEEIETEKISVTRVTEALPTEIGEFPTHSPVDHVTEVQKEIPTSTSPFTEVQQPAKSTESILTSKPTEESILPEVEGITTEKEPMYTSPQLTTQGPFNATELYTSGPKVELSTRKFVEGELSTSVPVTPISTPEQSTSAPPYAAAPTPGHDIPGEQVPELPDYPSPVDDYEDEDQSPLGPGTCRYGGKVYVSAQQIPRDDPCDFCFCFRSDIICLQQSCPPPIPRCHEEPIRGFCCPRYECPVGMATAVNVTTSTTTTTTTLPPHFLSHAYTGRVSKSGCQIKGRAYQVGDVIPSASGPCLDCTCGGDGEMKCDPKACSPEPMLRQMIAAAASRRRR